MEASFIGYACDGDRIVRLGNEIYKEKYDSSTLTKLEDETLKVELFGNVESFEEPIPYFEPESGYEIGLLAN